MDLEAARARGDLSAIKRSAAAKAPARVPHADSTKIVTNIDQTAWALRVLQRKQEAGEELDAQQLATLERLGGSSSGGGETRSGSSKDGTAKGAKGRVVKVVSKKFGGGGGGGGDKGGKPAVVKVVGGTQGSGGYVSKKFSLGGGAKGGSAAPKAAALSIGDKLGMSLEDVAKARGKGGGRG